MDFSNNINNEDSSNFDVDSYLNFQEDPSLTLDENNQEVDVDGYLNFEDPSLIETIQEVVENQESNSIASQYPLFQAQEDPLSEIFRKMEEKSQAKVAMSASTSNQRSRVGFDGGVEYGNVDGGLSHSMHNQPSSSHQPAFDNTHAFNNLFNPRGIDHNVVPLSVAQPMERVHHPVVGNSDSDNAATTAATTSTPPVVVVAQSRKQFWNAGNYEVIQSDDAGRSAMQHFRVHPKFLHSNATSHKWALGAFAELLDNAMDEISHGATYVNIDVLDNNKHGGKMILIEDNGGGMNPSTIRHCLSLGYSSKSKKNLIGQYGNGFKTGTMRLGADVIVFSRSLGAHGHRRPTQSVGMLSFTFLRNTGMEDVVVPILDYEENNGKWMQMTRSSPSDWQRSVKAILEWSPYNEQELLSQFNLMGNQGTRVVIYNLWEDDLGQQEIDFDADQHDIQIRGDNREVKNIQARIFPNSKHFLTFRHSLRSYASILYLRRRPGFRIILRGKDVQHHNVIDDMMFAEEHKYRPHGVPDDMAAIVHLGFVKDAKQHVDVQGFNVYHKNRLIEAFWRVWVAAGSDGRGVIGVLEADFVAPAHDKQAFERTPLLSRLEARLREIQKNYWNMNCHKVGYAPRTKQVTNKQGLQVASSTIATQTKTPSSGLHATTHNDVATAVNVGCSNQSSHPPTKRTRSQVNVGCSNQSSHPPTKRKRPQVNVEKGHSQSRLERPQESQREPASSSPDEEIRLLKERLKSAEDEAQELKQRNHFLEEANKALQEKNDNLEHTSEELQDKYNVAQAQLQEIDQKYKTLDKQNEQFVALIKKERSQHTKTVRDLQQQLKQFQLKNTRDCHDNPEEHQGLP